MKGSDNCPYKAWRVLYQEESAHLSFVSFASCSKIMRITFVLATLWPLFSEPVHTFYTNKGVIMKSIGNHIIFYSAATSWYPGGGEVLVYFQNKYLGSELLHKMYSLYKKAIIYGNAAEQQISSLPLWLVQVYEVDTGVTTLTLIVGTMDHRHMPFKEYFIYLKHVNQTITNQLPMHAIFSEPKYNI